MHSSTSSSSQSGISASYPNHTAGSSSMNTESVHVSPTSQRPSLSGVKRYKKGRSFADTLFGKMRYGKDLVTQQWVAIKENRKWFAQNRVSMKGDPVPEDLFKEIEMMRFLQRQSDTPSHILKLLNVVEDDVYIYLVLELVDGGDFFSFIHSHHQQLHAAITATTTATATTGGVHEWECRMQRVFLDIARSIKWLHSKCVCHLDISLENTLIDQHDQIKVIDFGLAKFFKTSSFAMPAKRIGKPRCMSPEVFNVQSFDARAADTWSVGIMLFMMLLGIPPWNFPSDTETIFRMIAAGRLRDVIMYNNKRKFMSHAAMDLLIRFLKPENDRIYLDQVLRHPFCVHVNE
eukprot:CAMPEP_0202692412 /NCGR_PEP_ID=MMETSP1385-20130828/6799_1 /ASSEMBLY_ACC=CAM_ASM_000861 /TAXON_ID=933848 /ORGANISM="Elphidium margaritaceum" /LENGTH=346 /DNA_ID=CAMNT_0049347939 /DNA_START=132 /DNA_END=1172 /DNA_ORIENTATION=+